MAIQPLKFGQYYHVYNRGNNRENLFIEPRNYPYFLQNYAKHIQPIALTYAYCLLPNHFHFAIRTRTEEEQEKFHQEQIRQQIGSISTYGNFDPIFKLRTPSRAFNNFFIAYARAFNKTNGRTGALFESPFGRKIVANERYLTTLITYIHHNPQKHGFVANFRDWRWSSYGAIRTTKPTNVQRDDVLEWFGGVVGFEEAHKIGVDEVLIE